MFERPDPSFEPSSETKQALLYVRTRPIQPAGIKHPGYLGLHGYTTDRTAFLLVVVLELAGLWATYVALHSSKPPMPIAGAALVAFAFLAFDFLFAILHHRFSKGISATLAMEAAIAKAEGGRDGLIALQDVQDRLAKRKRVALLFTCALIALAIVKFMVFYTAASSLRTSAAQATVVFGATVFLAAAYTITAIIHIRNTGYFLGAAWARWLYKQDVRQFFRSKGTDNTAKTKVIELTAHADFARGLTINTHAITERTGLDASKTVYQLAASGLLLDTEIDEFINQIQDQAARAELALKAMQLQVRTVAER